MPAVKHLLLAPRKTSQAQRGYRDEQSAAQVNNTTRVHENPHSKSDTGSCPARCDASASSAWRQKSRERLRESRAFTCLDE